MTDVQNLNSYYSTNHKIEVPTHSVVVPPQTLPKYHLYNDIDATNRWHTINDDIYQDSKKEKSKDMFGYLKFLVGFVTLLFGIELVRKFFKKS